MEKDYNSDSIYDATFIRQWAKQIHEIKIEELRKKIAFKQEILGAIGTPVTLLILQRREELITEICRLKDSLLILTR